MDIQSVAYLRQELETGNVPEEFKGIAALIVKANMILAIYNYNYTIASKMT